MILITTLKLVEDRPGIIGQGKFAAFLSRNNVNMDKPIGLKIEGGIVTVTQPPAESDGDIEKLLREVHGISVAELKEACKADGPLPIHDSRSV